VLHTTLSRAEQLDGDLLDKWPLVKRVGYGIRVSMKLASLFFEVC
jgi:hypothetical protein